MDIAKQAHKASSGKMLISKSLTEGRCKISNPHYLQSRLLDLKALTKPHGITVGENLPPPWYFSKHVGHLNPVDLTRQGSPLLPLFNFDLVDESALW